MQGDVENQDRPSGESVSEAEAGFAPLHPERMTWAVLLGRWVAFARSSAAWPEDEAGVSMRRSVPAIIGLQAVWFALNQLDDLPTDEQALGVDRSRVLIDRHVAELRGAWGPRPRPEALASLITDAESAWRKASQRIGRLGDGAAESE